MSPRFRLLAAGLLAAAAACALPASAAAIAPPTDRYIVVFKNAVRDPGATAADHRRRHGVGNQLVYRSALKGYAGKVPRGRLSAIQNDPDVAYVEPDGVAHAVATQTDATWGLDRIDQRVESLDGAFTYPATGAGVTAYVLDTGIRTSHSDFGGRARAGVDYVSPSIGAQDCNGHGTHVAGTIGGARYGVAKAVSLVSVRVLDCEGSGYWSWIISGIDWVTAAHAAGAPAVANMSLGGGAASSVDDAVRRSIAAGVSYAIAAGNAGTDACTQSPARVADALTIGATDRYDTRASWSNHGACLDWFAPGVSITSAGHTGDTAVVTMSGTSMAAPHVAGAAALILESRPAATPADVRSSIWGSLTTAIVKSSSTANNHLLYVPASIASEPAPAPPPSAGISLTATGIKVKGTRSAKLSWSGATSTSVDVYRDATKVTTTANDGAHADSIGGKGGGTFTYKVCEAGTTVCSKASSITF